MAQTQKFKRFITQENKRDVMRLAWETVGTLLEANDVVCVEVREKKRSDEQNALLHAMLTEVSRKLEFNGKKLSVDQWKLVFVSAHAIATGKPAEMVIGLEGEVINLRESTAQMGVKRLNSLIEYIHAYCADKGMVFDGAING